MSSLSRLDRGSYTVPVWVGLLCTGIKTLIVEHDPQEFVYFHETGLPEWLETVLALVFTVAALVCIIASCLGTSWCAPGATLRTVYRLEFVGLVAIVGVLFVDSLVKDRPLFQLFTLGGGFGAIIIIGSMALLGRLWVALTHDFPPAVAEHGEHEKP